jgi:hypothetical protein
MVKKAMPLKKPVTMGGAMPVGISQRGGKIRESGLIPKKAAKIAEKVPTGPMKPIRY